MSLRKALSGLLLAAFPLLLPPGAEAADTPASLRAAINARWHVTVVEHDLAQKITPLVATPQRPVAMQDLSSPNALACLEAVATAFQAYPQPFISALVQQVALADMIDVWNIRVGGFHAPGLIALNCEDADGYEGFNVETMHEEISGLLLMKVPLDGAAWQAFNPSGFHYGVIATYHAELRDPHSRAGDDALHQEGFVSQLGLTGLGNDFGTYADRIFGHPAEFAAVLRSHPAMRGKARMVMALYLQQAPELKAQFAASGLTAAAQ